MGIYLESQWTMREQLVFSPSPVDIRYDAVADEFYLPCLIDYSRNGVMTVWTRDGHLKRTFTLMPYGMAAAIYGGNVYVLRQWPIDSERRDILHVWRTDGANGHDIGIPFGYRDGQLSGSQDADLDIDANGNLYVFSGCCVYPGVPQNAKTYRLQVFSPDGTLLRAWGTSGSGNGQFGDNPAWNQYDDQPTGIGIRLGADGLVYCTDKWNHRIQVFQPDGTFVRAFGSAGSGPGQLNYPMKVAVENEQLWVADMGGAVDGSTAPTERIQVFTLTGQFLHSYPVTFDWHAGGGWRNFCFTAPGELWVPSWDYAGTVYHYRIAQTVQLAAPVDRLFGFQFFLFPWQGALQSAVAALSGALDSPVSLGAGDLPALRLRADGALDAVFTGSNGATMRRVSRDMGASWGVC